MSATPINRPPNIAANFNKLVNELITMLEGRTRSDIEFANLDRLKKRLSLLKSTVGSEALIQLAAPFFIHYSEQILDTNAERRDQFFLTIDPRAESTKFNIQTSTQDDFFFTLADSIKTHYKRAADSERATVYAKTVSMLRCSIEYRVACGRS